MALIPQIQCRKFDALSHLPTLWSVLLQVVVAVGDRDAAAAQKALLQRSVVDVRAGDQNAQLLATLSSQNANHGSELERAVVESGSLLHD